MATQGQNSDNTQDPELQLTEPLTDSIEESLEGDVKRILADKKNLAKRNQRLKSANIDFEVDTNTLQTEDDTDKTADDNQQSKKPRRSPASREKRGSRAAGKARKQYSTETGHQGLGNSNQDQKEIPTPAEHTTNSNSNIKSPMMNMINLTRTENQFKKKVPLPQKETQVPLPLEQILNKHQTQLNNKHQMAKIQLKQKSIQKQAKQLILQQNKK